VARAAGVGRGARRRATSVGPATGCAGHTRHSQRRRDEPNYRIAGRRRWLRPRHASNVPSRQEVLSGQGDDAAARRERGRGHDREVAQATRRSRGARRAAPRVITTRSTPKSRPHSRGFCARSSSTKVRRFRTTRRSPRSRKWRGRSPWIGPAAAKSAALATQAGASSSAAQPPLPAPLPARPPMPAPLPRRRHAARHCRRSQPRPRACDSGRGPGRQDDPGVRMMMREHGLSPVQIVGTGHAGRITREDVLAFVEWAAPLRPRAWSRHCGRG